MTKSLKRILCIDDEEDILQVTQLALEHVGGFEVKACLSGEEAVQETKRFNPDLILLDAMMPHMDGPATLKELHKEPAFSMIPVIFMTARVQPRQIEEYKALGASGVISKPFDPMTLSKEVTDLWEKFYGIG